MFRDGPVRNCVQAPSHALEQPLPHQPREGDRGQPTLIEIAWANKAALGGKIQNALV